MSSPAVEGAREGVPGGRGRALRPVTLVVFVVLLGVAIASSVLVGKVVSDQEDRLLTRRTAEAQLTLQGYASDIDQVAGLAGIWAKATGGSPELFQLVVELTGSFSVLESVALVDADGTVVAGGGGGLAPGDPLEGAELALVQDAGPELMSTDVVPTEDEEGGRFNSVGFALRPDDMPNDTAVFGRLAFDAEEPLTLTGDDPFADLDIAVYASERPTDDQLLLRAGSGRVPSGDDVRMGSLTIGGETWAITTQARSSLVGSAAESTPWIVLAAGVVVALVAAAMAEVLARRQQFAEGLAEQRAAELEEAQEQLVRSERLAAIGGLASAVGHELRNPLGVISNAHYLLRSKLDGADDQVRKHLTTAERETAAATLIVSDLLEFARARDPIPTDVRVDELVAEALEVAPPPAGIEVRQDVESAVVRADRDQLRQVILNLLTNGYDALDGGGQIGVETVHADGAVRLRVWDTGTGIDDAAKDQIFEPFWTSKAKGIGLGLTVTRRIVEAHGGTLSVDDRPGGGTQFDLELPAAVGSP